MNPHDVRHVLQNFLHIFAIYAFCVTRTSTDVGKL